jgi:uncharacterized LabA/DUF88 family protein
LGLGWLNYAKVSAKLTDRRQWIGTRYYIGRLPQTGEITRYAEQRRHAAWLRSLDRRLTVHFGRLERRAFENPLARQVLRFLRETPVRIDQDVYRTLSEMARQSQRTVVMVEKEVDVMLAVDMVRMAERNEYDVAYLLTADGDYAPAVEAVSSSGKTVFAVSLTPAARLASVAHGLIRINREWLMDCFE